VVDWDVTFVFRRDVPVSTPFSTLTDHSLMISRYVAMHAMQEDSGHDHSTSNGYADGGSSQRKQPKPQVRDTLAAVGGMLIPLLTQIGHHH
jgi:zinc transporter 9